MHNVDRTSPSRYVCVLAGTLLFAAVQPGGESAAAENDGALKPAVPRDGVATIIDAFRTYDIVALGEGRHGNEQGHAFRLRLIRDPRFAATVNDIVVEFGNSLYQNTMDAFTRGDDVPYSELRKVWQNTTQPHQIWDRPIYEEFFRAVRDINASLPTERQLRVLLGDPPIDWEQVHSKAEYLAVRRVDTVTAGIIEREVIAKGRRALIVYGDFHYLRKNTFYALKDVAVAERRFNEPVQTIVALLERKGHRVFSILTSTNDLARLQSDVAAWPLQSIAMLSGTPIGAYKDSSVVYIKEPGGPWEKTQPDPERSPNIGQQWDAVLYLGPPSSITSSALPARLCSDDEYMKMRLARMKLVADASDTDPGKELRDYCAGLSKKK